MRMVALVRFIERTDKLEGGRVTGERCFVKLDDLECRESDPVRVRTLNTVMGQPLPFKEGDIVEVKKLGWVKVSYSGKAMEWFQMSLEDVVLKQRVSDLGNEKGTK